MDVTTLLSNQHREVDGLFDRYQQTSNQSAKADIAREIVTILSKHSAVEEADVYPVIKEALGEDVARSLTREHQELKHILVDIEHLLPSDPELDATVARAQGAVRLHVAEEEGEVFPQLRQAVDARRLEELGAKVEQRWASAPTHPHPHQPPANKVTAPVVGAIDKARDALRRH